MMKVVLPILMAAALSPIPCGASPRTVPARPQVESLPIVFNQETIRGFSLLIDARTPGEKAEDALRGSPAGPVVIFFQGHAQRPDDAYEFTSRLALLSRSGMVVVPVCDTPYGSDPSLRGDNGKDAVLMEMVRFVLAREGFTVAGYRPISALSLAVGGVRLAAERDTPGTGLVAVGWSHGGILARRFAHAYPSSVDSLGQVCPAGYERWSPWKLTARFAWETLRISSKMKGHAAQTMRSGWGFTKGFAGDLFRSIPAAVTHLHPGKIARIGKDISDCTTYCDSSRFTAAHLKRIAVIFGQDDSCMNPQRQLGITDRGVVGGDDLKRFHETFFSDVCEPESRISLRVLPGTHLAPVISGDLYAGTLLSDLGQALEP